MIVDKVSYPWMYNDPLVSYVKTTSILPVPVSDKLAFFNGRIFFAIDDVIYWTEYNLFGLYSPKLNNHRFGSRITMVKPVGGGIFVSDLTDTWFMGGMDPHSFSLRKVAEHPAYEWSDTTDYVEGSEIGADVGRCALWCSPEGAILGTSSGQLVNLNKEKVVYPETGVVGAGLLRGYTFINSIF